MRALICFAAFPPLLTTSGDPTMKDNGAEFFRKATNVSPDAAALLDRFITRLNEDGGTGLVNRQPVKMKKQRWLSVMG